MEVKKLKETKFLELTNDIVFKTLWYRGNEDVRRYLERMVEYAIGHPIGEYTLGPNEQGILTYEQIANKVDILLVSKDKTYKINVEMNRLDKPSKATINKMDNKSDVYLGNFVANFYNDLEEKNYQTAIKVEPVNFDTYYCPYNNAISELHFKFTDLNYDIVRDGVISHHLYLLRLKKLCYNQREDILKDFALLLSKTAIERKELALGNKEREAVVKLVESLERDDGFMSIIDRKEFERALFEDEKEEAIKEALEQGIEQGKEETKIELIKSLFKNKVSLEIISECSKISIEEVKEILEIE